MCTLFDNIIVWVLYKPLVQEYVDKGYPATGQYNFREDPATALIGSNLRALGGP